MTCSTQGTKACLTQGSDATILARVYRQSDAELLLSADIQKIVRTVYDLSDPLTPVDQRNLDIGTSFHDVLQLDGRWTIDTIGFNFETLVSGDLLRGLLNRIEVVFYMVDGTTLPLEAFEIQTTRILSLEPVP